MDSDEINDDAALLKIHAVYKDLDPIISPSLRLADAVKAAVLQGNLAPGDPVPSTAEIAKKIGINPMTAVKALQRVASLGIIKRSLGTNHIVCEEGPKLCAEIVEGEILGELRYLYHKMTHYLMGRSQIIQWLRGYEEADDSIEKARNSNISQGQTDDS